MHISDFDYFLPEGTIAQTPVEPRNHAKLMVLNTMDNTIEHRLFYNLGEYLMAGDTLVFNNTRVIPARLIGYKEHTGGKVEVFLLQNIANNSWEVLVRPGKKAPIGAKIYFSDSVYCKVSDYTEFGGRVVDFFYKGAFEEILDQLGNIPLPPYIHAELNDKERYQTVYSKINGSVAAPTAGLHFTKEQLADLREQGINISFVTLHVGIGTFRPVKVDIIEEHKMHREYYSIPDETIELIEKTKKNGNRIISVGTTSVRALETYANTKEKHGWSEMFIYPGYEFCLIDAMVTNFHLPKSSLLMLVSAFTGREYLFRAYNEAIKNNYRFFSFGDAMFIHR